MSPFMPSDATSTTAAEQDLHKQVITDVARRLRANDLSMTLANLLGVLVSVAALRDAASPGLMWLWLGLQVANAVFHLHLGLTWRQRTLTPGNAPEWLRLTTRTSLINGLLWALGVLIFWPGCSDAQRMMGLIGIMAILGSSLHALHGHLRAYYAITVPCVVGVTVVSFWHGGLGGWGMPAILWAYFLASARFATMLHRMLIETVRKGHQMTALTASLKVEKDRAVNLSQSRSRFLAAASHDLRQPVHALSLFVGALRQNPSKAQSDLILGHVGTAVDNLGAMFNALLDISKLDANLLQPKWQQVDLRPLMARISAEHTVLAQAKGLSLRTNLSDDVGLFVRTDPILLERVLRNLLSNAIRYTVQGRVLIRARVRAGRVELVVADTGCGIAPSRREEAFEEFVQLHDAERDPEQGLGLGLAIVRRLVSLLELRLVLRSRPGRGTVFVLHLPQTLHEADAPSPSVPSAEPSAINQVGLRTGDVVIVIDDNVAIQLAMRTVLSAWGCEVYTAASAQGLMPQLMHLRQAPSLLLCDSRLSDGEDGVTAIAQIREAFNHDVPAILITGDTGPERLREAVASGLPLLHKPVTQAHLQDAIARVIAGDVAPSA
ncbi:MAG: response regulator [Aquabacterium sp.]|nr:MAG: response regulator [Aquabacterium sp.]